MKKHCNILMSDPSGSYGLQYEINPWMKMEFQPDLKEAIKQWNDLKSKLEQAGAVITVVNSIKSDVPDFVFTANAATIHKNNVFVSRFKNKERQNEEEDWVAFFKSYKRGDNPYYNVYQCEEEGFEFEGAGDWLQFNENTFVTGHGMRSNEDSNNQVAEILQVNQIPMELVNPYFYHLDTCFCPLEVADDKPIAIINPSAFNPKDIRRLSKAIKLIEVCDEEGLLFACNSVIVHDQMMIPAGCPKLADKVQEYGFTPHKIRMNQFLKSGGAAKCLTLKL